MKQIVKNSVGFISGVAVSVLGFFVINQEVVAEDAAQDFEIDSLKNHISGGCPVPSGQQYLDTLEQQKKNPDLFAGCGGVI